MFEALERIHRDRVGRGGTDTNFDAGECWTGDVCAWVMWAGGWVGFGVGPGLGGGGWRRHREMEEGWGLGVGGRHTARVQ